MEASGKPVEFDRMSMISQASTTVYQLPKKDITEVKSFNAPPQAVIDVLQAVMLLLGHKESEVNWGSMKKLLSTAGENSLKQRVQDVDLEKIPQENLTKAKEVLSKYDEDTIAKNSQSVKALYIWADLVANN